MVVHFCYEAAWTTCVKGYLLTDDTHWAALGFGSAILGEGGIARQSCDI